MHKFVLSCAAACSLLLGFQSAAGAAPVTKKFSFTGAEQSFVVPAGVTSMHETAIGGKGGKGIHTPAVGGFGSVVNAAVAVTPGVVVRGAPTATRGAAAGPVG